MLGFGWTAPAFGWASDEGLAGLLAAIEALLWHSDGTDDHLVDQDGDILT